MTDIPQSHTDLLETRFSTLATISRDGMPHQTDGPGEHRVVVTLEPSSVFAVDMS